MDAMTPRLFSAADFRARLAADDRPFDSSDYVDVKLNPDYAEFFRTHTMRDAAVLVPIVDHPGEATVILTKRQEKLRSHSGQVAFPGGRIDDTDASPEAAALREAFEEIGLPPSDVEIIGRMPDYASGTGFRIMPVFGIVKPGFDLAINEDEVEAAFEVPLRFLMTEANHQQDSRVWQDKERFFYRMPFEGWMIWGMTAGIIRTIYERYYA
ncbi:MAG TPA: CoA pyrophosphatase [Rhizobiaceae bacterium]|nr:CoA pyrophosphatase [Rhizobiaceae bacterium]